MPKARGQYFIAAGGIEVNCPQFTRYTVELTVPSDHDDAVFSIGITADSKGSTVCIDQVHLRPKGQDLLCQDVMDEMASMQIPAIRFPGGIISTTYNWRHGTGPVHLRPTIHDAAFFRDWTLYYDFGTDEYLQLCLDQGIVPTITLNLATANLDESREWAEYAANFFRERDLEPPLIYWHIGNHPYSKTVAYMSADMYVQTVKDFAPVIREAYPQARIVGVSPPPKADGESEWLTKTLDEVGPLLDVIECQSYGGQAIQPVDVDTEVWNAGISDVSELMANLAVDVDTRQNELKCMIESCRQRGLSTNVGVAEWNYWTTASGRGPVFDEPDDALHALFIAGMLIGFTELSPDLEIAHFYNLVNCMGIITHRGPETTVHAGADVFKMFRPAFPGEVLPVESDVPALGESKAIRVAAIRTESQIHLLIVNYSATETAEIGTKDLGAPLESICLAADDPRVRPQFANIAIEQDSVLLPPLSATRLTFHSE
ncbi:MAG: hypothetical protein HRT89_25510 [Lentisphaeria bacterium]|nr:hypothetical protein [Lentisphaeria bacterium]